MWTQHGHRAGWDEMGGYGLNMDTGLDGMRWMSVDSTWTLGWVG